MSPMREIQIGGADVIIKFFLGLPMMQQTATL